MTAKKSQEGLPTLFPHVARKPEPKRPARTLMHLRDAGVDGYSQWVCRKCGRIIEARMADMDWSVRYREPCPWCGPTWGRIEAHRTEVVPAPSGEGVGGKFVPDGKMGARKHIPIVVDTRADALTGERDE